MLPALPTLPNLEVVHYQGRLVHTHQLFQLPLDKADSILILEDTHDDVLSLESDSLAITCLLHLCQAHRAGMPLRQKPWCQMLDWRCEKVLRKSPLLLKSGKFFITRDLEMGVVAITSYHPTIASILNDLSKGDRDGNRISQVPNSNDP